MPLRSKITPRYVINNLASALSIGLVPMLWGSPGIAKSASVQALADKINYELLDIRVSQLEPVDLGGIPMIQEGGEIATYVPLDVIPLENTPLPEGRDGWVIFFDEINHGKPSTVAAMYKVLLDKKVGNANVHPNVVMIAAGNHVEDRAMVNIMSTATKSRLCNLYVEPDLNEWLEDVAMKRKYDYRVISYLSQFEKDFYNFSPEDNQDSFCCPRSWSAVANLIAENDGHLGREDLPVVGGLLSPDVANKFISYFKLLDKMVTYEQIMKDPEGAEVPTDQSLIWASVASLATKADPKNIETLKKYLVRIDKSFLVLFLRMIVQTNPEMSSNKEVVSLISYVGAYMRS